MSDLATPSVGVRSLHDSDDENLWWNNPENYEVFQQGEEMFGLFYPYKMHVAEVNASVLTSLLLIRIGLRYGQEDLASDKTIWNHVYAILYNNFMF